MSINELKIVQEYIEEIINNPNKFYYKQDGEYINAYIKLSDLENDLKDIKKELKERTGEDV